MKILEEELSEDEIRLLEKKVEKILEERAKTPSNIRRLRRLGAKSRLRIRWEILGVKSRVRLKN